MGAFSRLIGGTASHFRILDELGAGGMGVVYVAEDLRLGRRVALKFLPRDALADREDLARFRREAQLAASVSHPNVCVIYEVDEHEGRPFIAMELVEGATLASIIAAGPMPLERALDLAAQVADGLQAAHERGIVHRDLKPGNVIVTRDGRAKVMDFGIALTLDRTRLTRQGSSVGTMAYMAPEQARGEAVDRRADLWSLGVTLYEMVTGLRPFRGENEAAVLYALLNQPPAPPAAHRPDLPPELERIVLKALSRDLAARYGRADELAADLRELLRQPGPGRTDASAAPPAGIAPQRALPAAGPVPPPAGDGHSVAVLPFVNMSGATEDDYLCEGLSEEIINVLTRIRGLRVIARTSSFAVARLGLDVREAGARLDVDHILEGSVRRSGRRVRVTVQLVETAAGAHLWSERYDRELTDVLVLEDEIADAVAGRLRGDLGDEAPVRRPRQVAADAHEAYLEGRYHFARSTPEAFARAGECYRRAIEQDPGFALAFDALAELYWYLGFFGQAAPRDAFAESTWFALRALELDGSLADTHALLGMLRKELDYNWPEVDREMARALALNGESRVVRQRNAITLVPRGHLEQALSEFEFALRSDPLSLFVRWWVGLTAYFWRRPERAVAEARQMIELDPAYFLGHWLLALGLEQLDRAGEALAAMQDADRRSGGIPFSRGFVIWLHGRTGQQERARELLSELTRMAGETYVAPSAIAMGHVGLEEWGPAFHWLDRAVEARDPVVMSIKSLPALDPVRGDERYLGLLRKMKLA